MQKKILFLGGSHFQLAPILYAKQQGHFVITCDYLPNNPGHQYADAYYNVSTTDQDAVLSLAQQLEIDAIVAFASDPSASTAAYVASKLNLIGNPFQSTLILTRKDLFREFLSAHQFNVPQAAGVESLEAAQAFFNSLNTTVMVKPVDSSGSKGVSKVSKLEDLPAAYYYALSFSRIGKVILEEFIARSGYQIAGDGFVLNGQLVFRHFGQEHFNNNGNPFVPIGESFPLQLPEKIQAKVHNEVQRLLNLLNIQVGALNFDIMLNQKQDVYLMEVGPRSGGNLISEVIRYNTGIDLSKLVVDAALNLECQQFVNLHQSSGYHSCYMLHSSQNGFFNGIEFDVSIQANIMEAFVFVKAGDAVQAFTGSNHTLGCLILKFDSAAEMLEKMVSMCERVRIIMSNEIGNQSVLADFNG